MRERGRRKNKTKSSVSISVSASAVFTRQGVSGSHEVESDQGSDALRRGSLGASDCSTGCERALRIAAKRSGSFDDDVIIVVVLLSLDKCSTKG